MIGVTAAASAGVYLNRGYIDPGLAMPVMLGVIFGALLGARILVRTRVELLRHVFSLVILIIGTRNDLQRFSRKAIRCRDLEDGTSNTLNRL